MNNNKTQYQLELDQMETFAQFLESLANATKALETISGAAPYLNFNNESMIQRYYDSFTEFCLGMNSLKQGFYYYAESNNIYLEENVVE